jgi:2-polyprenyl-3-methyl-5-hydroxy-6-metoxy-1,4-benzoquinol methylase
MNWFCFLLCGLFLCDALRLRAKFKSLPVLPRSGKKPQSDYICVAAPGLDAREETIAAAAEYAKSCNLELLDLVPGDAPALELMRMFHRVDPGRYRTDRIGLGYTTGYGLLVSRELLERCGVEKQAVSEIAGLYRLARVFKKYAIDKAGIAVATDLKASPAGNGTQRWPVLYEFMGLGTRTFILFQGFLLLALLASVLVSVPTGLIVIAAYHAEVLLVFAGQRIRPRDLIRAVLLRSVLDILNLCKLTVTRFTNTRPDAPNVRELRSAYAADLAGGIERFFEERRDDCPVCGGRELKVWIRTTDLFQSKPGQFTLDRCFSCGHVFQNPRLSLAGLEFYYRDFYDGLGALDSERLFQAGPDSYLRRAEAVRRLAQPTRWLDVGAAYGHFCCYARSIFPNTEFDGLDMNCSIDEAVRTGWVNRGFRGQFPEIAPQLAGQYDVVSIFHCLEHVLEPAEEIRSAHTVLAPNGLIIIEVPNPECWFGRVFRRFWWSWVQPQHLNLLSPGNLSHMLRQNGFEPVLLEGTYVQKQFDIMMSTAMLLNWLAPKTGQPWQARATALQRLRRVIWIFGFPMLLLAGLADLTFGPIARRLKIASAYRLLARRVDISDPAVAAHLRSESRELQFE